MGTQETQLQGSVFGALAIHALLALAAVFLPISFWASDLYFFGNTYGEQYEIFELFGFSSSLALACAIYYEAKRRRAKTLAEMAPALLAAGCFLLYVHLMTEYSQKSWDYNCYERAAKALVHGQNPYPEKGCYLYPPLTAQVMAASYRFFLWLDGSWQGGLSRIADLWIPVFYLYRSGLCLAVLGGYLLCFRFSKMIGFRDIHAGLLVTALIVFNSPMIRTMRQNQVNFWVLDLALLAIILVESWPILAGLALSLGAHIKLYPMILAAPWLPSKKWRAVTAAVAGFILVTLLQTDWGRDLSLWAAFQEASARFPQFVSFKNNSLQSIFLNTWNVVLAAAGIAPLEKSNLPIRILTWVATAAAVAWLGARFISREKAYRAIVGESEDEKNSEPDPMPDRLRLFGHSMDMIALALIASPLVWVHHYVLALPLIPWMIAMRGNEKPWQVFAASALIFAVPIFDVYPIGFCRLAGLIWLMLLTPPGLIVSFLSRWRGGDIFKSEISS